MEQPNEGLRERKKRAARAAISATARRLFAEHGYDVVTVADVAAAADVSQKTVFNYFPTKEDLAFAGREEGIATFVTALHDRAPGTPVLEVFRTLTHQVLDVFVAGEHEDMMTAARILLGSPTLQARLTAGWESGATAIADAVGDDLVAGIVARTLWFTHRSVFVLALRGLLDGEDPRRLARRLHKTADQAYDQLAGGLAGYGA